jgi:hypothetical protein
MSTVYSRNKKETQVVFLNKTQELVKDINDYIKGQKNWEYDGILRKLLDLTTSAYIEMSNGNNIKIQSLYTYFQRTNHFIDSQKILRTMKDYITVVVTTHEISDKRSGKWCLLIDTVITKINAIKSSDAKLIKKNTGDRFTKAEIQRFIDECQLDTYVEKMERYRKIAILNANKMLEEKITANTLDDFLRRIKHIYFVMYEKKKQIMSLNKSSEKLHNNSKSTNNKKTTNNSNKSSKKQEIDNYNELVKKT